MKPHRNLNHFLDNPLDAVMYGYKPCYLDCLSWTSSWLCKKSIAHALTTTAELIDCRLRDMPVELFKCLMIWLILLSIPFGGYFILGTFAWFTLYRPAKLKPRVEKMWEDLEKQW